MKHLGQIAMGLAVAVFGACGGTSAGSGVDATDNGDGAVNNGDGNVVADAAPGSADAAPGAQPIIFTILMENHDYAEIVGSANAPYVNSLIAEYGLATNYNDTIHPSLGNYLYMISGANQYPGFIDLGPKQSPFPVKKDNLGTQFEAKHIKWRAYAESMGAACKLTDSSPYATKHMPFMYFDDMQNGPNGLCAQHIVDYANFPLDLATGDYQYMWITPNLTSDGHDPSSNPVMGMKTSDAWLAQEVPKILNSSGWKAGGILFITWDEAEGRNGDDPDKIPMIVISPHMKQAGMKIDTHFTHGSYLATIEDLLNLGRLPTVPTTTTPNLLGFVQ
jgi:hypothetical protein